MDLPTILLIAAAVALALCLTLMLICFFKIFFAFRVKETEEYPVPAGHVYAAYREQIIGWIKQIRAMEHTDLSVTSFDGLKLCGKYYEYKKGAPIEILFHGYRGSAERDLCGGVDRCFRLGHNALIVDQRAAGASEGRVITFGNRESRDCLKWVELVITEIDPDAKIIITGISMGAATVMTAASMDLPRNVIGVLADCGYTSTRAIVKKVIRDMHLPAWLLYPFARLGAIVFGGFDPDATSPIESMKKTHLPVIFFHGECDSFVPHSMSVENYEACASEHKRMVSIEGAEHGLCFPAAQERYIEELKEFFHPAQ